MRLGRQHQDRGGQTDAETNQESLRPALLACPQRKPMSLMMVALYDPSPRVEPSSRGQISAAARFGAPAGQRRLGLGRADERDFLAVRKRRTTHAFVPDPLRQLGLIDPMVAASFEESDRVRQREDRLDLELAGRFPARFDQATAHAHALNVLGDRQAPDLGQVFPEYVQGDTADNPVFVVDGDEELADRLVELGHRPPDHQLLLGKHEDLFVDAGDVTNACGTNGQSRDLQGRHQCQVSKRAKST